MNRKEVQLNEFKPVFPAAAERPPLASPTAPRTTRAASPRDAPVPAALNGDDLRRLLLQRGLPIRKTTERPMHFDASVRQAVFHANRRAEDAKPGASQQTSDGKERDQQDALDRRLVVLGAARNAVRASRTDEAVARFQEYLAAAPNDWEVREELAGVLANARRFAPAAAEYEAVLRRQPDRAPRLRTELGNMHVQAKEFGKAVEQFSLALAALPDRETPAVRMQRFDIAAQLARALAFDGDLQSAARIYSRHLRDVGPEDADAPRLLGALLLDLDRAEAAVTYLKVQRTRRRSDFEVLAYLVCALAAADDPASAATALEEMARGGRGAADALVFVGALLAPVGETRLAEAAFAGALRLQPNNLDAQLGTASVLLADYQLAAARAALQAILPDDDHRREYLLLGAVLFVRCGEFADAKAVYQALLEAEPADVDARLGLAGVFEFARDHERAKAEYLKVDPGGKSAWKGRVGAMRVLAEQRRFPEAAEAADWLLHDPRLNVETLTAAMNALCKCGLADRAVEVGRDFAARATRPSDSAAVEIAIGRALLTAGRSTEALVAFDAALAQRSGRTSVAFFGRAKAAARGRLCDLGQLLAAVATARGSRIASELSLVDLFVEDRDDARAEQVCRAILERDLENAAAWVRLCECLHRQAIQTGDIRAVVSACRCFLERSPTNIRVLMTMARCRIIVKDYRGAAANYDRVISVDPDFSVPYREKARALYTANDLDGGRLANRALLAPGARSFLEADVRRAIPCVGGSGPSLEAFLDAGLPGPLLCRTLQEFLNSTPLPAAVELGLRRSLLDFEARSRLETAVEWEDRGKTAKGLRDREAIRAYTNVLESEPDNTEASMDLAQCLGTVGATAAELNQYSETLAIDPRHRDAAIASDRAFHEINPQLRTNFILESERGRSRLADILRLRFGEYLQWPLGDEAEYCRLGLSRATLFPRGDASLDGNILTVQAQKRICPDMLLFGAVNYEHYEDRLHSMPTYDAGAEWSCDQWRLRGEALSEFVVQNGESLRQSIWRQGTRWTATWDFDRRWDFLCRYGYWRYSDGNDMNEATFRADYRFCFLPDELRGVLSVDWLNYREPTVITRADPFDPHDAIHPYFTPRGFVIYEGRLEWTQYLSRDHFLHSNNTWYSLQYGAAWDSEFVHYDLFRALFAHDVGSWLSFGLDGHLTLSRVYDGAWLGAWLTLRWPLPDCRSCAMP